jgi:glutathione S-transferase
MKLRSSPFSPFGRKVVMVAHVLGLADRLEIATADTSDPNDPLRVDNPLGKLPVLVLEDGSSLYDSRVIVDYLDHLSGEGGVIPKGAAKFPVLRMQALADGILDASILQVYENRFRSEERREPGWISYQAEKVKRALAFLEGSVLPAISAKPDAGAIALACALGYQDLRFQGAWRKDHPKLVAWLKTFAETVPSFELTRPPAA